MNEKVRIEVDEQTAEVLKWIQRAINQNPPDKINQLVLSKLDGARNISWLSPLSSDDFAEYRDAEFLGKIGAAHLVTELAGFWPSRGPQWDALGCSDTQDVLLVEAKAHIEELCSSPSQASPPSRAMIVSALYETAGQLGAEPCVQWADVFYQLANRLAHLYFLRKHGVEAWLLLVNFTGDAEMHGPTSQFEWEAAYQVVWHVLGMKKRHPLSRYIVHIYPNVTEFRN